MKRLCFVCSCFVIFLTLAFQCGDENIEPNNEFYFRETVSIYPFKKEYRVGDTIWIETLIPDKQLFDLSSNQDYLIDTLNIPLSIYFFSRHPRRDSNTADENDFRVINSQNLNITKGKGGIYTYYGCGESDFKIRLGLILGNKGVFTIELNEAVLRLCNGNFPNIRRPMIGYRFDVEEGNKDIYLAIPETSKHINDNLQIQRSIDAKTMVAISVK